MSHTLFVASGAIFVVLGLMHAIYTLLDQRHPRRLVPVDAEVMRAMQGTGVRLARGSAGSMWQAWIGFNLSHSLGAIVFGAWTATSGSSLALPVAAIYLAIGWRGWFWIPNACIAVATLGLVLAALTAQ